MTVRQSADANLRKPIPAARLVAVIDVCLLVAALVGVLVGANIMRMPTGLGGFLSMRFTIENLLLVTGFAGAASAVFHLLGLYRAESGRRWWDETRRAVEGALASAVLASVFPLSSESGAFSMALLPRYAVTAAVALVLFRSLRARIAGRTGGRVRVLIVGTGPQALRIHRDLCADGADVYRVLGFVDTDLACPSPFIARRAVGPLAALEQFLVREHVDEVYIGLPVRSQYREIHETLRVCERIGVQARYRADIFDTEIARPCVDHEGQPGLVRMRVAPEVGWLKRGLDIAGAAGAIVALAPVMLAAVIAIKLTSRGPAVFAQERYGLNRRHFRMFKFRTMVADADRLQASLESRNEADGPVFKIAHDPRITRVGRFLRRTSIDELPQLVNVLRGDMSLVGPRPLPLRDVARFTRSADMRRFSVRPGLTCLWQVSGRSGIGFDEWVRLDLQYIDRWSLGLDFSILARTVPAVLRGTGAR